MLLDTDHLDYSFLYYTFKRRKATLRISAKKGRPEQEVVDILESCAAEISRTGLVQYVIYDTGTEKRGRSLLIGGE